VSIFPIIWLKKIIRKTELSTQTPAKLEIQKYNQLHPDVSTKWRPLTGHVTLMRTQVWAGLESSCSTAVQLLHRCSQPRHREDYSYGSRSRPNSNVDLILDGTLVASLPLKTTVCPSPQQKTNS